MVSLAGASSSAEHKLHAHSIAMKKSSRFTRSIND